MATGKQAQLMPWARVEYIYSTDIITTAAAPIQVIDNGYFGTTQSLNITAATPLTGNVLDRSAVRVGPNKWAHLDIDRPIRYLQIDNQLTLTELGQLPYTWDVTYDTVRVHLQAGYNLEEIAGFIMEVSVTESSGSQSILGSVAFLRGDSHVEFNPRPMFLDGQSYDRYVEFKVPALSWLNQEFWSSQARSEELAYYLSSDGQGFAANSRITLALHTLATAQETNGQLYMAAHASPTTTINPADEFSLLAATIRESDDGDYFEYFPTWDGGFIEDYLATLSAEGGSWVVHNTLVQTEQLGMEHVVTKVQHIVKDSGFDQPWTEVPLVLNADQAYSFSIDYTVQLLNKMTGFSVYRQASVTSLEPKKYGRRRATIQLRERALPMKIYNKVVDGNTFQLPQVTAVNKVEMVKVPAFYDRALLGLSVATEVTDPTATVGSTKFLDSDLILGQGKAIITLGPFDNYVRLRLFQRSSRTSPAEAVNLSFRDYDGGVSLVFIDDAGGKVKFEQLAGDPVLGAGIDADPAHGDMLFHVPGKDAQRVLTFSNRNFYIVSLGGTDMETMLYVGRFDTIDNMESVRAELEQEKQDALLQKSAELAQMEARLTGDRRALEQGQASLAAASAENEALRKQLADLQAQLDGRERAATATADELTRKAQLVGEQEALVRQMMSEGKALQESQSAAFQAMLQALKDQLAQLKSGSQQPPKGVQLVEVPGLYGGETGANVFRYRLPAGWTARQAFTAQTQATALVDGRDAADTKITK